MIDPRIVAWLTFREEKPPAGAVAMISTVQNMQTLLPEPQLDGAQRVIRFTNSVASLVSIDRWLVLGPWRVTRVQTGDRKTEETETSRIGIEGRYGERAGALLLGQCAEFTVALESDLIMTQR